VNEKPEDCQSCYYATKALTEYDASDAIGRHEGRTKWLCDLCASTETGKTLDYPRQYEGQAAAMRTSCYVGNVILDALKKHS
jgi:hypothetical protein